MEIYGMYSTQQVTLEDIPDTITRSIRKLETVRKKVDEAREKADAAYEKAKKASRMDPSVFNRENAIRALQDVSVALSDAQIDQAEAEKASFEYEKLLANVCRYLFGIGVANAAANRAVVRSLKVQIERASEQELDVYAREELFRVIQDLRDQDDLMNRIQKLEEMIRKQQDELDLLEQRMNDTYRNGMQEPNQESNKMISVLKARNVELEKRLNNQDDQIYDLEIRLKRLES